MRLLFGARDALFLNDYYDKPHACEKGEYN
jgi:hypothetical protein